jgi:hypothetical protein
MEERKKKFYKRMTPKDFKMIKSMLSADISVRAIHRATDRAEQTVQFVKQSQDWAAYREIIKAFNAKYAKNGEKKNLPTVSEKADVTEERLINDLLKQILTEIQQSNQLLNEINEKKRTIF